MISLAFDNEVVLTDDRVIVETTYVFALPIANRQVLVCYGAKTPIMNKLILSFVMP